MAIKMEAESLYPNGMPHGLQTGEKLLQKGVCWACKICLANKQVAVNNAVKTASTNGSNMYSHLQRSLSGHNLSNPKKNLDNKGGLEGKYYDLKKRAKRVINTLHHIVATMSSTGRARQIVFVRTLILEHYVSTLLRMMYICRVLIESIKQFTSQRKAS